MTAPATQAEPPGPGTGAGAEAGADPGALTRSGALTGTGALIRLALRLDRIRLLIWIGGILTVVWFSAAAVTATYDTPEKRAGYAATVTGSPASVLITGPPVALDEAGGVTVLETGLTAFLTITLFAMFLTVRHTRAEEEEGRLELVRATVVGRYAQLLAAVTVVGVGCLLIGAGITGTFLLQDLPVAGSLAFGASVALTGICFVAISACLAQVTEHARGALGLTGLVAGVTYVLRGLGDVAALSRAQDDAGALPVTSVTEVGAWSWLSPYGWAQAAHPFDGDRWWPLLVLLVASVVLALAAVTLLAHRDLGAGLIAPRPGRPDASARLTGAVPLAVRLQRAGFAGWLFGLAALGAVYGSIAGSLDDLIETNPDLAEMIGTGADVASGYFQLIMLINALVAVVFTLTAALRLRTEETRGRAEPVLATATSRARWASGPLLVSAVGSAVLLAVTGLATGLTGAQATGASSWIGDLPLAQLMYLPACLVVSGFAMLLIGWLPRASQASWALVALAFVVGWLGTLLNTPQWLNNLSPFTHVPGLPVDDVEPLPLILLTSVAVLLTGLGLVGLRRRDISA